MTLAIISWIALTLITSHIIAKRADLSELVKKDMPLDYYRKQLDPLKKFPKILTSFMEILTEAGKALVPLFYEVMALVALLFLSPIFTLLQVKHIRSKAKTRPNK